MTNESTQVTVTDAVDAARERFQQIAPRGLDFTAEAAFAKQLLHNSDYLKKVAMANPLSLQAAIINVAAIGLSLNPAKKQAYLIPRTVKHKIDGRDQYIAKIFLEPSYMGLVDLATMSGSILWAQAITVHANDVFVDNGPGERPTHTYSPFDPLSKRGEMVGVYCVAKTVGGDYLTTAIPIAEIYGIRDRSEAWKRKVDAASNGKTVSGGPWETDFGEQTKKTVLRRAFKTWPKTDTLERMETAVQMSNENEGFEPILTSPSLSNYTPDQKAYFDKLITDSNATGMFVFTKTIDETMYTNLYHSFPKGEKGKYQSIVKQLAEKGAVQIRDIAETINEAALRNDDLGTVQSYMELSKDEQDFIYDDLCKEAQEIIKHSPDIALQGAAS